MSFFLRGVTQRCNKNLRIGISYLTVKFNWKTVFENQKFFQFFLQKFFEFEVIDSQNGVNKTSKTNYTRVKLNLGTNKLF